MTTPAPLNTRYAISVLSTNTVDSRPSLLLTFDNARYLFNTPESISRICVQSKIALKKVGHVFLGDLEESGGLPGFVLSTVEAGNSSVQLFGPEATDHFMASCRFFTRRDKLALKVTPVKSEAGSAPMLPHPVHADGNVIVYAYALSSAASGLTSGPATTIDGPPALKRKRSQVSPSPPPRSKSPPPLDDPSGLTPIPPPSLLSLLGFDPLSSSFSPSQLRGEHAATWRSLVLADMFRGTGKVDAVPSSITAALSMLQGRQPLNGGRRVPSPAYLSAPLPSPYQSSGPATAISYLVVGPALRGKFQPHEAEKRGVKSGVAYKRLIAGERVWVTKTAMDAARLLAAEKEKGVKGKDAMAAAALKAKKPAETKKERNARLKREKEAEHTVVEGEGEGTWVYPGDCMTAGQPAKAFLVLNIPSQAHLDSLASTISTEAIATLPDGARLRTVFYLLGPDVLHDDRLTSFMHALDTASPDSIIEHRISSPEIDGHNPVTFVPSALLTLRLNYTDPSIFSLPHYSILSPSSKAVPPSFPPSTSLLNANDRFDQLHQPVSPESGVDFRNFDFDVPSETATAEAGRLKGYEKGDDVQTAAKEAWERYVPKASAARQAVDAMVAERKDRQIRPGDDLQVTPLGTGSAIPSKYRNVSSTLLHLPGEQHYVLLDAGEGTWGQMARRFGQTQAEEVLRRTKLVFVSHLHQDHHAGLATLLRRRAQLFPPPSSPLTIIAPPGARIYLQEQHALFDLGLDHSATSPVRFVDSGVVEFGGRPLQETDWRSGVMRELRSLLGLVEVATVPVLHRCRCWGLVITHTSGWKAVFSGDTMPCEALAVAGRDASLLIHEATIQDDMPEVALAKGHSTFAQAIDIARKMRARHLLLTHFSARYPKLPPLSRPPANPESDRAMARNPDAVLEPVIAVAFDMATMRLDEFWKMEQYRDAMDELFGWDDDGSQAVLSVMDGADEDVAAAAESAAA